MIDSPTIFSPHMLNDVQRLKTLFTGEDEIRALDQLPKETYVRPSGELYMNRWQVSWIFVSAPFRLVLYVFLKATANFLECFAMQNLSRRVHVQAHHLAYTFNIAWNQLSYGKRFLAPCLNDYRKDISDVYTLKNIYRENILDPTIREKLHPDFDKVHFDLLEKLCHGSVYWFNYLFLKAGETKTAQGCETYTDYALAISKLFEHGQPRQAALMQSLYGLEKDLLDIEENSVALSPPLFKSKEWLGKLADGIYLLDFPEHSVSYIKYNGEEMVMDPIVGLIQIEKPEHLIEIIDEYTKNHEGMPILFARQHLKPEKTSWFNYFSA